MRGEKDEEEEEGRKRRRKKKEEEDKKGKEERKDGNANWIKRRNWWHGLETGLETKFCKTRMGKAIRKWLDGREFRIKEQ